MEASELIERIASHCEAGEVDKATLACLRLAQKVGDAYSAVLFLHELRPDKRQLMNAAYDETKHLKPQAQKFVWETTHKHWIDERTVDFSIDANDPDKNILAMGIGELVREVEQMERSIEDNRVPPGMGAFDTAAFIDRNGDLIARMRLKIRACHTIIERVRTRCLYYALRIERQLKTEGRTTSLVGDLQSEVHNYYAARSETAYQRLQKAADLLGSSDAEDHALLLTSIRRAVKAVADYHYPATAVPVLCSDGNSRVLGEEQYLNRLDEFCRTKFGGDTSSKLLRAEFDFLSVLIRRINEVASKGVHAEVTSAEARQGLLGLYIFLFNLITKLERATP